MSLPLPDFFDPKKVDSLYLERGALVLSSQAVAAAELHQALIVDPRDIAGMARAIERALDMPPDEQTRRLRAMRGVVSQYTVFRWAAQLLVDGMRIAAARRMVRSQVHVT